MPENQLADKDAILENLAALSAPFSAFAEKADRSIKSRAWNDKKISAHHAIIPTTVRPDYAALSEKEKNLYGLIARAYIAQFYPAQEFLSTKIDVSVGEEIFTASGKVILQDGWKALYQKTTEQWKEEIWNGIRTGYNNGFTEGCNTTIKTLKRVYYGFRSFANFRRRIMYILNSEERQSRRTKKS